MISEDKIVKSLQDSSPGAFIGNDAAILPHIDSNQRYVITKDLLVEDVHFRTKYYTPQDLAHKALHANLSDIAAMGAKPLYILCGISISHQLQKYAVDFLHSITVACDKAGVILIGGDTTASKHHLLISITALGHAPECNLKQRSTAKNDDVICVAGDLGFAHLGFLALEQSHTIHPKYINSFLRPTAKINEGIWLGTVPSVNSMMDISDGLYVDLKRLSSSSNKQAVLDLNLLESHLTHEASVQVALQGGEDYGLLFTASRNSFDKVAHEFTQNFGYNLKVIGHITDGTGISFQRNNQYVNVTTNFFTHFGEDA
ncbi:thiamine-phosphate kinase [Rickettsiales endosymbiont of Peranema trichophorum]|uniref:thiamine-phosphate kinase n=1 Tax=Rickettsiales endosymbiont of Peranema trichophorum TaxID=2486577 RepID=UPI0010237F84|nr:thiamine-phosphate kinase [Rickettsiales endosymbiont of Peranema trichophorum]RZI45538.1 thiamine-phosphate kinase [Rickettsiales endosymbiont of Peranema trichophorum]